MHRKVILHAQKSAEMTMTACSTGQAIFERLDPVPARAATSPIQYTAMSSAQAYTSGDSSEYFSDNCPKGNLLCAAEM
eukprot:6174320-Pleurochrysis_carterae.AAC.1